MLPILWYDVKGWIIIIAHNKTCTYFIPCNIKTFYYTTKKIVLNILMLCQFVQVHHLVEQVLLLAIIMFERKGFTFFQKSLLSVSLLSFFRVHSSICIISFLKEVVKQSWSCHYFFRERFIEKRHLIALSMLIFLHGACFFNVSNLIHHRIFENRPGFLQDLLSIGYVEYFPWSFRLKNERLFLS